MNKTKIVQIKVEMTTLADPPVINVAVVREIDGTTVLDDVCIQMQGGEVDDLHAWAGRVTQGLMILNTEFTERWHGVNTDA